MDIYTVTTIGPLDQKYHDRTPAACTSLGRAQEILEKNEGSLNEAGYYPYAVIERLPTDVVYPEIHAFGTGVRTQWWYKFDGKKYRPCRKPAKFKGTIGFGIG